MYKKKNENRRKKSIKTWYDFFFSSVKIAFLIEKYFSFPAYDCVVQYVFCNDEYIIVYARQKYSVTASTTNTSLSLQKTSVYKLHVSKLGTNYSTFNISSYNFRYLVICYLGISLLAYVYICIVYWYIGIKNLIWKRIITYIMQVISSEFYKRRTTNHFFEFIECVLEMVETIESSLLVCIRKYIASSFIILLRKG